MKFFCLSSFLPRSSSPILQPIDEIKKDLHDMKTQITIFHTTVNALSDERNSVLQVLAVASGATDLMTVIAICGFAIRRIGYQCEFETIMDLIDEFTPTFLGALRSLADKRKAVDDDAAATMKSFLAPMETKTEQFEYALMSIAPAHCPRLDAWREKFATAFFYVHKVY
ncbi:hypothetical protein Hypma_001608 [Hypsizygus marmoreus]|uniref:Uncharacterized protein n=1 Tax=Hypsizygus marmoreus TaxID=39966 RepID=A0A369JA14_HYPMA|nr:hypothetical protein Hypma_001608 [Hypsizygus marmoreus]